MVNVRFGDVMDHEDIDIEALENGNFIANVGFLKDHHVYRVHVMIPTIIAESEKIVHEGDLPILEASVKAMGAESEVTLTIRLDGIHGHLQSVFKMDSFEIAVRASVLKMNDGTPSLKRGVSIVSTLERPATAPFSGDK